ncbi:PKD1L3 [Branchiostoma lanceolatum]|uniref:PKD1L3 protein n=1 Tax=Branchiostoma lanceolatum TaxID=7740 RepID=A0A8J9VC63_BRALA|nr:PKD1L3 [Branchiostoma lanceolatum]
MSLYGAWVAEQADLHQWLKVDLQKTYFVTALITQGRNNCPCNQWITSYYISYGEGNGDENIYKDDDDQMVVFPGNADGDSPVRHQLSGYTGPIAARYVTFHPLSWTGNIALRAGVVVHSALEPVGRWPLNEQYGATDATGNGNDGIASGTKLVEGPTGPLSQAFLFSDNGPEKSYINITNNGKLDVRYSYTILAHVYPTGVGRGGPLFHYRGSGDASGVNFWLWDWMLYLSWSGGDGQWTFGHATCPYGWYPNGFVCYKVSDELVTWETANSRCEREGGRLATVKDISTNNFLVALKKTVHLQYSFWFGLKREDQEPTELMTSLPMGSRSVDVTINGLKSDSRYNVKVRAVVGTTESHDVTIQCITISVPLPEGLHVVDITETSVQVSWQRTTNALVIAQRVWIRRSDTDESLFTHLLPTSETDVTFDDLIPSMEYVISAINIYRHQEGPEANLTVATKTDPPASLEAMDWTTNTVTISWLPSRAVLIGYDITYTGSGESSLITKSGDLDSCELTGLVSGTRYDIDVVAVGKLGKSVPVSTSVVTERAKIDTNDSVRFLISVEGHRSSYNVTDLLAETEYVIKMAAFSAYGRSAVITYSHSTATSSKTDAPGLLDIGGDVTTNGRQTTTGSAQGIDGTGLEASRPDDILEMATNINDIIQSDTTSVLSSSVLKTTAELVRSLTEATRGSQGASVETMEAITTVLMQTASTVLDMAPEQEPPIPTHVDNPFESYLVDLSATDLSPKQQLKKLRDEQKEREDAQQLVALSLVASLDQVADTLLTLQPANVEYEASFETGEVSLVVAKRLSSGNLKLESGNIAVNTQETTSAEETPSDVKVTIFQKNPYSWSDSTGGQNISSPVVVLRLNEKNPDINGTTPRVTLDFRQVHSDRTGQPTTPQPHITTETPRGTKGNGTALTYQAFSVPSDDVIPVVTMTWRDFRAVYHVYSMDGSRPTVQKYAERRVVQAAGLEAWFTETDFSVSFVPNTTARGDVLYVGVHELGPVDGKGYRLRVNAVACLSWKDRQKQWRLGGCRATVRLNDDVISCTCDMESRITVGTSTLPVPNSINFVNAFQNFCNLSDNAVVFSIVVAEFALYTILMVLLRAKFKRKWEKLFTLPKVSLIPPDRMPASHVYQVTVTTGSMFGAGTTSRIGLKLHGSKGTTPLKMLNPGGEVLNLLVVLFPVLDYCTSALVSSFVNAFQNFRNLSDNAVVFSIVVAEFALYTILMVLLRAKFKRKWEKLFTLPKVSLIPPDRMPASHVYQVTVTTGSMFGAGTTSRIGLKLHGSKGTTPLKMLNPGGEALVRGSTLHFVMPVRASLGEVTSLHIWHDNSGEGDTSSWFLRTLLVRDVETDAMYYFICNNWLSDNQGDCEVQMVVHASTQEELRSFPSVFSEATRDVFYDAQLWVSTLVASPGSSFTQAQRLSCCFTLLNTMMLSSAMWYRGRDTTAGTTVYNLGVVQFTAEELYISLMTALTVAPINMMIVKLFRLEAPLSVNTPEMVIRTSQGCVRRSLYRLARYVAWVTVFLVSTSSAFFVILYSMDWGKESDSWMKAFILSFMGSSCVMDTLQVMYHLS